MVRGVAGDSEGAAGVEYRATDIIKKRLCPLGRGDGRGGVRLPLARMRNAGMRARQGVAMLPDFSVRGATLTLAF